MQSITAMAKKFHAEDSDRADQRGEVRWSGRLRAIFTSREKRSLWAQTFRGCELDRIDFSNADLRQAQFLNTSLSESDFSGADLRGASFIACHLRGANFTGATFGCTRFDESWLIGLRGTFGKCRSC